MRRKAVDGTPVIPASSNESTDDKNPDLRGEFMFKKSAAVFLLCFLFTARMAQAGTLFEGWYEVYKGADKIGFVVERYELTDGKFKCTYYLKTNAEGNSVTESVKAFSKSDLTPISYAYTTKVGDTVKVIDANFKDEKDKSQTETVKTFDGKKQSTETHKIKRGTFLSQFLLFLILSQKDGLSAGKDYTYYAIAEEDGEVHQGSALVKNKEDVKGRQAYKILNEYKGEKFFTWISEKGQPLLTRSPENNIDVRFADNREQATKGMMVNLQDIKLLFGNVPGESGAIGNANGAASHSAGGKADSGGDGDGVEAGDGKNNDKASGKTPKQKKLFEKHPVKPGKGAGVPQGQGIEIKGVKPPEAPKEAPSAEGAKAAPAADDAAKPADKQ